jgi:hypothetical protein
VPARVFLNNIVWGALGLDWKYDEATNTVALDVDWRVSDPRSPKELLQTVWKTSLQDADWQRTFDALLSHPRNFEKAWRVRQRSYYESPLSRGAMLILDDASRGHPTTPMDCLLVRRMISTSHKPYIVVVIRHQMVVSPGHSSIDCYWFNEDGTLEGADLLNTGHRCGLTAAKAVPAIDDGNWGPPYTETSELQLVLDNYARFFTARLVLTDSGVKIIKVADLHGKEENGLGVGESLMNQAQK